MTSQPNYGPVIRPKRKLSRVHFYFFLYFYTWESGSVDQSYQLFFNLKNKNRFYESILVILTTLINQAIAQVKLAHLYFSRLSSTGSKASDVTERFNRMSVGSNESNDPAKTTSRNLDFKNR